MKKLIFALSLVLAGAQGFAQNDLISSVFEKYAGAEGITTVNISGDMLKLMTKAEMDRRDTVIESTLSEVRILAVEDECKKPADLNLKAEVFDKLDKSLYKEMISVKQTDEDVVVMIRESNGWIQEILVIVGGPDENALIQVKGNMLLSELADMAGKFQMKGFEHLKKFEK